MQKKSQYRKLTAIILGSSLLGLVGCGNSSSGHGSKSTNQQMEAQPEEGQYGAMLVPMNTSFSAAWGSTVHTIKGLDFLNNIRMNRLAPNMEHMQFVHTGTACPTAASDTNGDRVIDVNELMAVS